MQDPGFEAKIGTSKALNSVLMQRDLILVTGKGGVGKSSMVAALARQAAHLRGGAVALEVTAQPQLKMLIDDPSVKNVNIDLERALPAVLGRMLHLPQLITSALSNRVLRMFARTSPAAAELLLLDEIFDWVQRSSKKNWPVIVDLPATGHAVSFLATPGAVRRMLRVGPVATRAGHIERLLQDAIATELLVVTIPEELPVNETIELVKQAKLLQLNCRFVVANQVPTSPLFGEDRLWIDELENHRDAHMTQTLAATREHLDCAEQAQAHLNILRAAITQPVLSLAHFASPSSAACVQSLFEAIASDDLEPQPVPSLQGLRADSELVSATR